MGLPAYIRIQAIALGAALLLNAACGGDPNQLGGQETSTLPGIPLTYRASNGVYSVDLDVDGQRISDVLIDTGSSNLIILGNDSVCADCSSATVKSSALATYTPSASPIENGDQFTIRYGIGEGEVRLYDSEVAFSDGAEAIRYPIGVFVKAKNIGNILGLGYAANLVSLNNFTPLPFLDEYILKNKLRDIFTLNFCPRSSELSFMTVGTIPETKVNSQLKYTAIAPHQGSGDMVRYDVSPTALWVDGEQQALGVFPESDGRVLTFVDSGTTLLYLPDELIHAIADYYETKLGIPPSFWTGEDPTTIRISASYLSQLKDLQVEFPDANGGSFKVNLSPKTFTFTVGDSTSPSIVSAIRPAFPLDASGTVRAVILGSVFMQNSLVVFDREQHRIGFAPNKSLCQQNTSD